MKVLHAPLNLANDPWSLVQALKELGVEANLATIASSPFTEVGDIDLSFTEFSTLTRQIAKWNFANRELKKYDLIHYHTGHSIVDYGNGRFMLMDMKAAKARGQKIALSFHGCEVRDLQEGGCPWPCSDPVCKVGAKAERLRTSLELADLVYVTTPDLLPAVPGAKLLPQSVYGLEEMGKITDGEDEAANGGISTALKPSPLRVVHLPSKRSTKGTEEIIAAVDELRYDGADFEFALIEGKTHAEAIEAIREADIVIDHVQVGWYGVVSVEAAAHSKPVIVRYDDKYVSLSGLPAPSFTQATKANLKQVLSDMLALSAKERAKLGAKNRAFVIERHSAHVNAARLLEDYKRVLAQN